MAIEQLNSTEILSLIRQSLVHLGRVHPDSLNSILTQIVGLAGAGGSSPWTQDINGVWNDTDDIGIGTQHPAVELDVVGTYYQNLVTNSGVSARFQVGNEVDISVLGPPNGFHGIAYNMDDGTDYFIMTATDVNNNSPFIPYYTVNMTGDSADLLLSLLMSPGQGISLENESFINGNKGSAIIDNNSITTSSRHPLHTSKVTLNNQVVQLTSEELGGLINTQVIMYEDYFNLIRQDLNNLTANTETGYDEFGIYTNIDYPSLNTFRELYREAEYKLTRYDAGEDSNTWVNQQQYFVELYSESVGTGDNGTVRVGYDTIESIISTPGVRTSSGTITPSAFNFTSSVFATGATGSLAYFAGSHIQLLAGSGATGAATHNIYIDIGDGTAGHTFGGVPVYPDNATASGAGLGVGTLYKTAAGELRIVV